MASTPNIYILKVLCLSPKRRAVWEWRTEHELRGRKPAFFIGCAANFYVILSNSLRLESSIRIYAIGYLLYRLIALLLAPKKSLLYFGRHAIIYEYTANVIVVEKSWDRSLRNPIAFWLPSSVWLVKTRAKRGTEIWPYFVIFFAKCIREIIIVKNTPKFIWSTLPTFLRFFLNSH